MADLAEGAPATGWFAVIAGEEMGPFSEAELRVLASRGAIASSSKVRAAEATEQISARDVPGLYAPAVSAAAAPAAAPAAQATRIEVRFQAWLSKAVNDFGLHGKGAVRIEPNTVIVVGSSRGGPVALRFNANNICDITRDGRRVGFKVRSEDGSGKWMIVYARSADAAHDLEASLPKAALREGRGMSTEPEVASEVATDAAPASTSVVSPVPASAADRLIERIYARTPALWVIPGLIAIIAIAFLMMVYAGAGWITPEPAIHVRFGSNLGSLTSSGQWWRLVTNIFIHFGVIHLGLNLWALWSAGGLAERLFGHHRTLMIFLVAGIAGSIASLGWNAEVHSAGASGAIFGLLGALAVALFDKRNALPVAIAREHRASVIAFIGYSLVLGFIDSRIDNAAHLGGLLAGAITGLVLGRPNAVAPGEAPTGRRRFGPFRADAAVVVLLIPAVLAAFALPVLHRARLIQHERAFETGVATLVREERELDPSMQGLIESLRSGKYSMPRVLQGLDTQSKAWAALNANFARLPLEPRSRYAELHGQLLHYTGLRSRAAQSLAASLRNRDEIKAREGAALLASARQIEQTFEKEIRRR